MIEPDDTFDLSDYISAQEAAELIGVTPRSISTYIQNGDLDTEYVGTPLLLRRDQVVSFQRKGAGRKRTTDHVWRKPSIPALLIRLTVPLLEERQWEELVTILQKMRTGLCASSGITFGCLSGTEGTGLELDLIWKPNSLLHCPGEREAALATLLAGVKEDLNLLDWEKMTYEEKPVLLLAV